MGEVLRVTNNALGCTAGQAVHTMEMELRRIDKRKTEMSDLNSSREKSVLKASLLWNEDFERLSNDLHTQAASLGLRLTEIEKRTETILAMQNEDKQSWSKQVARLGKEEARELRKKLLRGQTDTQVNALQEVSAEIGNLHNLKVKMDAVPVDDSIKRWDQRPRKQWTKWLPRKKYVSVALTKEVIIIGLSGRSRNALFVMSNLCTNHESKSLRASKGVSQPWILFLRETIGEFYV